MNNQYYYGPQEQAFNPEEFARRETVRKNSNVCMILGIICVSASALGITLAFVLGIISLVYYSKTKKILLMGEKNSKLTAGKVCSIIGIVNCALSVIFAFFAFWALFGYLVGFLSILAA